MTSGIAPAEVGMELRLARLYRENVETKARRYLIEGRLQVTHVNPHAIKATCRGTEQIHQLGYRDGSWSCSCPAKGRCSHIAALQLVTLPTGEEKP